MIAAKMVLFGDVNGYLPQMNERLRLIRHETNQGVGGAIAAGYECRRDHEIDAAVVMAGDAQMDPADLPALLDPVVAGKVDYAKGNRLFTGIRVYEDLHTGGDGMSTEATSTFQAAREMAGKPGDQEMLIGIMHRRLIEQRRAELATDIA
ncbi:MAG: glycosyltransferase, partial [Chloroflexota bacterium]|nr:glycosyltransferase [Chloroflexota bacterium]